MQKKKKKSFGVGAALAVGGVVVGSLGCFEPVIATNPAPVDCCENNPNPDQPEDLVIVNPAPIFDMQPDSAPDADMDRPDQTIDMDDMFTVNPGPFDMSVDGTMDATPDDSTGDATPDDMASD